MHMQYTGAIRTISVKIFNSLSAEMVGLIFILVSAAAAMTFPEVADFWLALATAITLFVIMYVRSHPGVKTAAEEKTSP